MNLLSKLHKNSILTGPVESYCLACGFLLHSEEESYAHIHEQDHVVKLGALLRLENYKEDCIIKSKDGYFCPFCNLILPTIKRVSLHVTEPKHRDNKNSQSITRHAGLVFAFNVVIINDRSWNGLDGSTCFVCNEDYDDEEDHKKEATHVLNLIQIKCEFGDSFIYRKVDEDLFFCLICNDALPIAEKQTHHESERHLELYDKCKAEGISIRNKPVSIDNKAVIEPNNNNIAKPEKSVQITQNYTETKNNIDNCLCYVISEPKVNETIAHNGSAHINDDNNSTTTNNDQQSPNVNTPEVKLEKNTIEAAKLNTEKTTQVQRLNTPSKNSQESVNANKAKVSKDIDRSNNEIEKLNTEKDQTSKELQTQNKNSQETAVPYTENTKEFKDKPKTTLNTDSVAKHTGPKISNADNVETDKTNKLENVSESFLNNYIKSRKYIVKSDDDVYCILCNVRIKEADTIEHSLNEHHIQLYEKQVAKNSILSENIKTVNEDSNRTNNKSSETIGVDSVKIDKENAAPVIEQANKNTKNASIKNVIPTVVSKDTVNDTNIASLEQPNKIQSKPQTENEEDKPKDPKLNTETAPNNKVQNGNTTIQKSTNERNEGETKPEPIPVKRVTKKAQRKAAKAKTAEIIPPAPTKDKNEIGTQSLTVCETGTVESPVKENINNTEVVSKILENDSKKNLDKSQVNAKDAKKNSNKVEVNGEDSKKELNEVNVEDANKDLDKLNGETMAARFVTDADLKTDKLLNLLKTVAQVDNSSDDVVINSKYVLGDLSFVLVVRTEMNAECVACDQELSRDEIYIHILTEGHRSNVEECLVVTSLDDEFIRQVKTQEYHCGYCNMLVSNWGEMKDHLESYRHSDAKTSARWRLERYHPHLRHCQTKEVRSVLTTIFRSARE